ncbi:MgtC/SapB family protein [Niveibacterium sp. 24ML]|uniref:MgtC/SapB family protein n=1 Tax=Niveibacterium sp. 24ML TaxID=2985512 RepID=UPI00226EFAD0|nr:MgtC/SapB family protein [Niveibacterium sp. 24ML]MCX9156696.1 MgtC/SapB family protein [Niveibacterium sp. 24ML]
MEFAHTQVLSNMQLLVISAGIGFLIGLERERNPAARAGVRTFTLVALFGALATFMGQLTAAPWITAVGLLAVAAMIIAAHLRHPDPLDAGTTSVVAVLTCYLLGAMVWLGQTPLAVIVAVAVTALLYFKTELSGIASRLTRTEWISMLQFATLSLVVLPILPDKGYGPYGAINPHQVWWMVVLISGVSLAGYAGLRLFGDRYGTLLVGLAGGLVSSTATTLIFARHARGDMRFASTAGRVILLANLVMLVRLSLFAAVVAPSAFMPIATSMAAGLIPGALFLLLSWRRDANTGSLPLPQTRNPTEVRVAIGFAVMYGAVLLISTWLTETVGTSGLYAVALASGLTDVDAISLSSLQLQASGKLAPAAAATAVVLAALSNLAFKAGTALVIGGRELARPVAAGMGLVGGGLACALVFQQSMG